MRKTDTITRTICNVCKLTQNLVKYRENRNKSQSLSKQNVELINSQYEKFRMK